MNPASPPGMNPDSPPGMNPAAGQPFVPPEALSLGPLRVQLYSVFILVGVVVAYLIARPEAKRFGITAEQLQASLLYGLLPGIAGARLYHVLDQFGRYAGDPISVLAVWNGGLGILGGLAGGAVGLWLYCRRRGFSLLRLLDVWAPGMLAAQAIGRFGNWTNQEAFGQPTDGVLKTYIDPAHRPEQFADSAYFHPTYFYEAGYDFLGVLVLLALRPRLRERPGAVLGAYFIVYAVGRAGIEFFRTDTAHTFGLPTAQLIAAGLVCGGIYLLSRRNISAQR